MIGEKYGDFRKVKEIIDFTYPGIRLLHRDTNLGTLDSKYEVGMILREFGFVDASLHRGGMVTSHRMAILSNHYADLQAYEHGTNWGLCVLDHMSHYKVLDRYSIEGKTQIILLHLPENGWEVFDEVQTNVDAEVIEIVRTAFEKNLEMPPVPELTSEVWLKRCAFPIGMTESGDYFPIEDQK